MPLTGERASSPIGSASSSGDDLGLGGAGHELAGDRIVRGIGAVDQRQHLGRDGDRHRLRGRRQARVGRQQPLAFEGVERAQGLHGGAQ